jgi:integrase
MPKKRRMKGSGSIRLRGRIRWITYYAGGRPISESSGSAQKEVAANLLKQRIGELASGRNMSPEKATIGDLCALVLQDAKLRKLRDARHQEWRYEANIKPILETVRADRFGPSHIRTYVDVRRKDGVEDSTINRELAILRRGFVLGYREEPPLVRRVPHIPRLEENDPRKGFIGPEQYEAILRELPDRLKALFVCGYHLGCRLSELRKMQWDQVDFGARQIRIAASQAKNKEARTVPVYGEMEAWLQTQRAGANSQRWVFYGRLGCPVGAHLDGWRGACERGGAPDLLFHDLRRSAVRNMTRAGIPRPIAMAISGHKTESVYRRYDIVSGTDLANAAQQLERFMHEQRNPAKLERVK